MCTTSIHKAWSSSDNIGAKGGTLYFQTTTIAQMLSTAGEGVSSNVLSECSVRHTSAAMFHKTTVSETSCV